MSTATRLISGSAASWMRIGIITVSQIALVPLYLNYWTVETYGVWLALQAIVVVMTMVDLGHQTYLGFEFLRLANRSKDELSLNLWSGIVAGACIGVLQILLILAFIYTNTLPMFLGKAELNDPGLVNAAGIALLLQGIAWLIASSTGGLFVRALEPFGYYPRLAWWGVFMELVKSIMPAVAVVLGADLLTTGAVLAASTIIFNIPIYLDMFHLMRKLKIEIRRPSMKLSYANFIRSTAVAGKLLLENARQQGVRLVLAPLSGATALAAFSTMRTGSNVALQGLNTITNPLMPDLMRFLHARDQERSEAAFGTVWVVVVALMAPAVVILQVFIEPLFLLWTQGQIEFDPILFAVLSITVLVYAVTQPAMAVVMGNNLMRPQLLLSLIAAVVVIAGIIALVPWLGIAGAGLALLAAETVASIGYTINAKDWLARHTLAWPSQSFKIAVISVVIAAVSMGSMIFFPGAKWLIFSATQILFFWNLWRYWQVLPELVAQRIMLMLGNMPGVRKL